MKDMVSSLTKKMSTDTESSSDWLVLHNKLVSVNTHNKHELKTKNKLPKKLVIKHTVNKLDKFISKYLKENQLAILDSTDKLSLKDGTPVTITSVYHPKNNKKP